MLLSGFLINDSVDASSLYGCGLRSSTKMSIRMSATTLWQAITNMVALRKPTESNRAPLTDGPKKAPSANVDVHKPEIRPYVSMLSGRPRLLYVPENKFQFD